MIVDHAVLRDEILTDPRGYGYLEFWNAGNLIIMTDLLNRRRAEIRIKRADISGGDVFNAVALADLINNPGAASVQWLNRALDPHQFIRLLEEDGTDSPVKANVLALVRSGTPTLTRLQAFETRDGSRVEELFGANVRVLESDLVIVRNMGV